MRTRALVAGLALAALVAAQLLLSWAIHGTNYSGGDGKFAQATILTAYTFSGYGHVNSLNPIQGAGSPMLPMNVWANPAYWPFAFLPKEPATDVSAAVALGLFALAAYVMARCFDAPVVSSLIGAQLSILIFAPAAFMLQLSTVFCIMVGNAVVYAPHMIALGLLARLAPGSWRDLTLVTAGICASMLYSLYCDPLWSVVHGFAWAAAFAVVAIGPLHVKTILVRGAALAGCALLLWVSGVARYVHTLTQYTARAQFPGTADRSSAPDLLASELFYSPYAKYFYLLWALGWLLGALVTKGRVRLLAVTGLVSGLVLAGYTVLYLLLNVRWQAPLPVYLAQALFPLFVVSAVAGYSGALGAIASWARRIAAAVASRLRMTTAAALVAVAVIPVVVVDRAVTYPLPAADQFHEPWRDEPELLRFFEERIGLAVGRPFRGSAYLWPFDYPTHLAANAFWARGIPTVQQYGQLVTPPSFYLANALNRTPPGGSNGFVPYPPYPGSSWMGYANSLQLLGARYHLTDRQPIPPLARENFPLRTFPSRLVASPPDLWYVYELPRPNVGDYSPTEVYTAGTGAEIAALMREPSFDFTRAVVLSSRPSQPLVPARDMRLSPTRGGFHVSGRSDGTSLAVLPLQFSRCLRARDGRVRLVRANLMLAGLIFSGAVDTDLMFDYGMFTPRCRAADLADLAQLDLKLDVPRVRGAGSHVFPGWPSAWATLTAAAHAIK